jgi:hypothetical protein
VKVYVGRREQITVERWRDHHGWSQENAERNFREHPEQVEARVYVQERDPAGAVVSEQELEHLVKHSPSGLGWGYSGSGPSDTARSLLIDFFGGTANLPERWGEHALPVSYQDFKADLISLCDDAGFEISEDEVRAWVEANTPDADNV